MPSIQAVLSDAIVLWRMCIVWGKKRPFVAFGTTMLAATFGLNVANIVWIAGHVWKGEIENPADTENVATYGISTIGIAAAFMSLASNLSATILVGVKAWCFFLRAHRETRLTCS